MTTRWSILFIAAAAILIGPSAAPAQTKDQCAAVMRALIPAQMSVDKFGESMAKSKFSDTFNLITENVTGNFKIAAEEANAAQANFVAATIRLRIAMEEVVHEAQLCAR
jgi:hypothetical protein